MLNGVDDPPDNYQPWIVKFRALPDPVDVGAIEHAYAAMAREAGVDMPETTLFPAKRGPGYFGARRLDRRGNERPHMHTVSGLLNLDHTLPSLGYVGMIKAVRHLTRRQVDVDQAFTRMVFNVVAYNRDDHTRNHGFLMAENGEWSISPGYDVTFSSGPGGEHALDLLGEGRNPGPDHILAVAGEVGVGEKTAVAIIDRVRKVVGRWPAFASNTGVSSGMTTSIDRVLDGVRSRRPKLRTAVVLPGRRGASSVSGKV